MGGGGSSKDCDEGLLWRRELVMVMPFESKFNLIVSKKSSPRVAAARCFLFWLTCRRDDKPQIPVTRYISDYITEKIENKGRPIEKHVSSPTWYIQASTK